MEYYSSNEKKWITNMNYTDESQKQEKLKKPDTKGYLWYSLIHKNFYNRLNEYIVKESWSVVAWCQA